jgi:hypothetical protein
MQKKENEVGFKGGKKMKKQFVIIIIILMLVTVGLSGCNENGNGGSGKSYEEKILGAWGGIATGDEETSIFKFYSNGSFSVNAMRFDFWEDSSTRQTVWGTYVMTDETLATEVFGDTEAFEYSFSEDGNKLTLIAVDESGEFIVLSKYSSPPVLPSIKFLKDDDNFMLTVISVSPSNLPWNNIRITGTCDTSDLGTYVVAGDTITDCFDIITIRDKATNFLLGSWTFSFSAEDASVAGEGTNNQIKMVLASGGNNYNGGYNIAGDVVIFINGQKVKTYTTVTWETGGQILLGLNGVEWEEGYTCPEGDYVVTVAIKDWVVFDGTITVG